MLMTGEEIVQSHRAGEIVIDPFCPDNVNSGSYDVTLGPLYWRQRKPPFLGEQYVLFADHAVPSGAMYNPYNPLDVDAAWELHNAEPPPVPIEGVGEQDLVIPIGPKEIILTHTLEFIGSTPQPQGTCITTQMHARSSTIRSCIDVCGSGGYGDHSFHNRWTQEITNLSPHYTTYLVVGRRYAQISFWRTAPTQHNYAQQGKYQADQTLDEMKTSWCPTMLLPRTYQDREVGQPNQHQDLIQRLLLDHPIES